MSGYKEKISIVFIVVLCSIGRDSWGQSFEGLNVGVDFGIDFHDRYVDNAIVDRYVKHESRLGLMFGYSKMFKKVTLNTSLNPYVSLARITPHISSNLDPGPENRKDYFGFKSDVSAFLGSKLLRPALGLSIGLIPKYPYEIKNYLKNSTTALEWGIYGGIGLFAKEGNLITLGYYYGSIVTGEESIYDTTYGIWQIDYRFSLSR